MDVAMFRQKMKVLADHFVEETTKLVDENAGAANRLREKVMAAISGASGYWASDGYHAAPDAARYDYKGRANGKRLASSKPAGHTLQPGNGQPRHPPNGKFRPAGDLLPSVEPRALRKMPKQFCPVPKCKNAAALIFGMVCKQHKAVPKKLIAKYRDARRALKAKASK